jgi:hypothetical protein
LPSFFSFFKSAVADDFRTAMGVRLRRFLTARRKGRGLLTLLFLLFWTEQAGGHPPLSDLLFGSQIAH